MNNKSYKQQGLPQVTSSSHYTQQQVSENPSNTPERQDRWSSLHRHFTGLSSSRSARIPALGLLTLALLQQALHDTALHLVLAPALTPLGVTEDWTGLHAVGLDRAGRRAGGMVLVLVLVSVLQLVGVLWLGLVVGLGVLRVVLLAVVLVVLLVVLQVRVLGFDWVDSA